MDGYFPLFISLKGKNIQVFGGGRIAARRVKVLLSYGARIKVTAPEISKELEDLTAEYKGLALEHRKYCPCELEEPDFVLAATNDQQVNDMIARECRHKEILVNHVSRKEMCDFFFPGIVQSKDITIGVTANGNNHKKAAEVTGKLRTWMEGEEV